MALTSNPLWSFEYDSPAPEEEQEDQSRLEYQAAPASLWDLYPEEEVAPVAGEQVLYGEAVPQYETPEDETTIGEFATGAGLSLATGAMRGTKALVDLAELAVPKAAEPYITDPWINLFDRGIEAAEDLTPEAYKKERAEGFLERAEDGSIEGVQLPSAEHAVSLLLETLPMIPSFIAGGKGAASAASSAVQKLTGLAPSARAAGAAGYGVANAALIAPGQYEETYQAALDAGDTEEVARDKALFAANLTTALTALTGGAGGYLSESVGATAGSLSRAAARGFAVEGPFEGIEEAGQSIIGNVALGEDINLEDALDVGLSATALGGAPGAAIAGLEYQNQRREDLLPIPELEDDLPPVRGASEGEPLDLDQEPQYLEREDGQRVAPVPEAKPVEKVPVATPALDEAKATVLELETKASRPAVSGEPVPEIDTTEEIMQELEAPVEVPVADTSETASTSEITPETPAAPAETVPQRAVPVTEPSTQESSTVTDIRQVREQRQDESRIKKFHADFMGTLRTNAKAFQELTESAGHLYEAGDTVVSASSGRGFKIVSRTMVPDTRDISSDLPHRERQSIIKSRPKVPGYIVRTLDYPNGADSYETMMPEWGMKARAGVRSVSSADTGPTSARDITNTSDGIDNLYSPAITTSAGLSPTFNADAVAQGLTKSLGKYYADRITITTSDQIGGASGRYSPDTGEVKIAGDKVSTPAEAAFLGWHELYHNGVDNNFNPVGAIRPLTTLSAPQEIDAAMADFEAKKARMSQVLKLAGGNPLIDAMARMQVDLRSELDESHHIGRTRSIEEALVDLGAAVETGDFDIVRRIYGKDLANQVRSAVNRSKKSGTKSPLQKLLSRFADFFRKLLGKAQSEINGYSDAEIFKLLKQIKRSILAPRSNEHPSTRVRTSRLDDGVTDAASDVSVLESPGVPPTKIDRAGMNQQREARGAELLGPEETTDIETIKATAQRMLDENPELSEDIRIDVMNDAAYTPSVIDIAVMHRALHSAQLAANASADKIIEGDQTPEVRAEYKSQWNTRTAVVDGLQEAINLAAGRLGRSFRYLQEELTDPFTEANMVRRTQVANDGEASPEVLEQVRKQAAAIRRSKEALETARQRDQEAKAQAESEDLTTALKKKIQQQQQEIEGLAELAKAKQSSTIKTEPQWIRSLEVRANKSRKALEAALKSGRFNAVPLDLVGHLVNIGVYHMAKGAYDIVQWTKAMRDDLGPDLFGKIEADLPDMYNETKNIHDTDRAKLHKQAEQKAVAKAHAQVLAGQSVSHKSVYDLARSIVEQNPQITESELMAQVTELLQANIPEREISEREVRQAYVNYGKVVEPTENEVREKLAEISSLVKIQEDIDRLTEGKDPLKTGRKQRPITEKVKLRKKQLELAKRVYEHKHPHTEENRLVGVNERRANILRQKIAELQERLKTGAPKQGRVPVEDTPEVTHMRFVLEALQDELSYQDRANQTDPVEYDRMVANRLRREERKLRRRLAAKDYRPPPKRKYPETSIETKKLQFAVNELKSEFLQQRYQEQLARDPWYKKGALQALRYSSYARAVKTSLDLSAFGRQSAVALAAHPRMAGMLAKAQAEAALSAEKADAINYEILHSPMGIIAKAAGVFFNDPHSTRFEQQEEAYMDHTIQTTRVFRITGVAASARAYNTGLNVARLEYFTKLVNDLTINNVPLSEAELQHIAYWVNRATGRGGFNKKGQSGGSGGDALLAALSLPFFAPRWVQSRFSVLSGWPLISAATVSPRVFRQIASEYAKASAGLMTMTMLIASAFVLAQGDDLEDWEDLNINLDPGSSDFLRIRVGDTRIEVMAGLAQTANFIYRVGYGVRTTARGEKLQLRGPEATQDGVAGVIGRFVRSKLSPVAALTFNTMTGEDFLGQPTNLLQEIYSLPVPLAWSEILELPQEHPAHIALMIQALNIIGAGSQTYKLRPQSDSTDNLYSTTSSNFLEGALYESSNDLY